MPADTGGAHTRTGRGAAPQLRQPGPSRRAPSSPTAAAGRAPAGGLVLESRQGGPLRAGARRCPAPHEACPPGLLTLGPFGGGCTGRRRPRAGGPGGRRHPQTEQCRCARPPSFTRGAPRRRRAPNGANAAGARDRRTCSPWHTGAEQRRRAPPRGGRPTGGRARGKRRTERTQPERATAAPVPRGTRARSSGAGPRLAAAGRPEGGPPGPVAQATKARSAAPGGGPPAAPPPGRPSAG
jgi:hypothetical protein